MVFRSAGSRCCAGIWDFTVLGVGIWGSVVSDFQPLHLGNSAVLGGSLYQIICRDAVLLESSSEVSRPIPLAMSVCLWYLTSLSPMTTGTPRHCYV